MLFALLGYNGTVVLNDFYEFKIAPISIPASSLSSDLKQLVNNPAMSDIQFLVEGKTIYASKLHLAARSDHFKAMLNSGMKESTAASSSSSSLSTIGGSSGAVTPIEVLDVTYEVFEKVIEYIYTDSIEGTSPELAVSV